MSVTVVIAAIHEACYSGGTGASSVMSECNDSSGLNATVLGTPHGQGIECACSFVCERTCSNEGARSHKADVSMSAYRCIRM